MLTVSFKFIDYSDYAYWSESRLPSSPVVYIAWTRPACLLIGEARP